MGAANRKVLLFTDKCPEHPADTMFLKSVTVIFFPPHCTNNLQPTDLGVIHSLKAKHREVLVCKATAAIKNKTELKLNILQAMHMVVAAWNSLSSAIIRNCYRKAGFPSHKDSEEENKEAGVED
jgi:hypothetical protein